MSTPTVTPAPSAAKPSAPAAPATDTKPTTPAAAAKPELAVDFISDGAFLLTAELAGTTAPVRARNDKQRAMDTKVKELHAAWVKAGKPSTWDAMVKAQVVATYFTEPDKTAELHKLINRAVTFHTLRVRMGTPFRVTEAHIKRFGLPPQFLGREAVSFAVLDKRPRATSDGKPAGDKVTQNTK